MAGRSFPFAIVLHTLNRPPAAEEETH